MIPNGELERKLNARTCFTCKHGLAYHTHPAKRFWSQGAVRKLIGDVVTRCGRTGCTCESYRTEPLTTDELIEMTRRIKCGWRGRT